MKRTLRSSFVAMCMLGAGMHSATAVTIDQYATTVLDFSSEWSSTSWSASQALGAPDTVAYGDIPTAWAPRAQNGTLEYITMGFLMPVYAHGVTVRETYGNGFVYQIDAVDTTGVFHTVWTGADPSLPGTPVDFLATWTETSYLVDGVKIYTYTDHDLTAWEEIDSIQLHGTPVPVPTAVWLFGSGLLGLIGIARRRKAA